MSLSHIQSIVAATNELKPDITLLLGDYVVAHRWISGVIPAPDWARVLGQLRAPLGVHAVLGNHDWWDDETAQRLGRGPTVSHRALQDAGIAVYHNDALRLTKDGSTFWLAGLGDQFALRRTGPSGQYSVGLDDLTGTLAKVPSDAAVVLMAHEPDIFPKVPPRVSLMIAGHTHGGQVRLFGQPLGGSTRYRSGYSYGHYIEASRSPQRSGDRQLIVSGGLGCSSLPVRLGVPPEIVIIDLENGVAS